MYLSNIELLGFKSFPFKTKVEFANGITGVVGPNGCGKTNVLDAIRWVLGEQRTSILRGGKMEDIIFSGTRELKPLGMAEVRLTVINNRNVLPTEYSSVTITRRLHRSGDSEYLLNNVTCRLKDITELFADTGMGANAYSAIELEMVEAILSDKADQRRVLFEEAAGITKYKLRKRAALRKLEATENDLLRLADILSEVTTQVNSLRRQMRKAEQYKTLDDKIRNNSLILLKDAYRRFSADLRAVQEEKRVSEIKLAQIAGEIDKWELMREDTRSKAVELSAELHEVRTRIEDSSTKYHELHNELSVTEEKIKSAETANEVDLKEIDATHRKREQLVSECQTAEQKLAGMKEELSNSEQEADQQEVRLAEKLKTLEEARRSSQDFQRDLFVIEGQKSLSEQSGRQLDEQIEELRSEVNGLRNSASALVAALTEAESAIAENREQQQESETKAAEIKSKLESCAAAASSVKQRIEDTNSAFAEARYEAKSIETHVHLQEQMIAHYEGYGSGVSALFADDVKLPGVIDTVANLIKPHGDFVKPIELALGASAEYVVVRDRDAAEEAIEYLRATDSGRVTFLIAANVPTSSLSEVPTTLTQVDGYLGDALEHVDVADECRQIAALVLGNVLMARNREAVANMESAGLDGHRVVSLDGYYLKSSALYESGSDSPPQLLGRENELERLRQKLTDAREEVTRLQGEMHSLQDERSRLAAERTELTAQLESISGSHTELQLAATRAELHQTQLQENRQQLDKQVETTQGKLDAAVARREALQQDSSRLAGDTDGKRTALEMQEGRVDEIEREANVAAKENEELRLRVIKLRTEVDSLAGSIRRNLELIEELEVAGNSRQQARTNRIEELQRLRQRVDELRTELEIVEHRRGELRKQEESLTERQGNVTEKQSDYEELLKKARKERDNEAEEHEQLLVRETEGRARFDDINRQLRESHGISAAELTLPEPLSDEMAAELEKELVEGREKQAQLGMVNMLALEEYERENQREEFLRRQIEDLTSAKDNLKTTITRINSTARKMFVETFDKVRVNFQQVFAELFQGGEADLRLEDEGDPLESPILISARPRGKRLLTISQLSGGEKALTAISLLFGIYLVKPSPFCILDEVDAPLDDANVGRFLKMVKTFSERTQFIIITHNKRTMEKCNRLYGVTMQKPGVSQIVSVDFERIGRDMTPDSMSYQQEEAAAFGPEIIEEKPAEKILPVEDTDTLDEIDDAVEEFEPTIATDDSGDDEDL